MVYKDPASHQVLYRSYVQYETVSLYAAGVNWLESKGFEIQAIVCDGRRRMIQRSKASPVQLYHFHQIAAITRYLNWRPRYEAAIELRKLAMTLCYPSRPWINGMKSIKIL